MQLQNFVGPIELAVNIFLFLLELAGFRLISIISIHLALVNWNSMLVELQWTTLH